MIKNRIVEVSLRDSCKTGWDCHEGFSLNYIPDKSYATSLSALVSLSEICFSALFFVSWDNIDQNEIGSFSVTYIAFSVSINESILNTVFTIHASI